MHIIKNFDDMMMENPMFFVGIDSTSFDEKESNMYKDDCKVYQVLVCLVIFVYL